MIFYKTIIQYKVNYFLNPINVFGVGNDSIVLEDLKFDSLSIKNADSDLVNQIKAILQLSFPINPLKSRKQITQIQHVMKYI